MTFDGRLTWNNRDDTACECPAHKVPWMTAAKNWERRAAKAEREREQLRAEVDEMWVKARRVERLEILAKEQAGTIKEQKALIEALRADQRRPVHSRGDDCPRVPRHPLPRAGGLTP